MDNRRFGLATSNLALSTSKMVRDVPFSVYSPVYKCQPFVRYNFHKSLVSKRIAYKVFCKSCHKHHCFFYVCFLHSYLVPNIRNKFVSIILVASGFLFFFFNILCISNLPRIKHINRLIDLYVRLLFKTFFFVAYSLNSEYDLLSHIAFIRLNICTTVKFPCVSECVFVFPPILAPVLSKQGDFNLESDTTGTVLGYYKCLLIIQSLLSQG